jgi:CO/xanthine dehydrogenase Mo-binding subunit
VALDPETGQGKPFATYVYATQIAEVEVDDETGETEVLRIVASHDCGTPINPMLVEGQVEGGISMGVGFALQEEILFDAKGRQMNPNLTNYIMPTSLDMPEIQVDIVDNYDPTGPVRRQGRGRADVRLDGRGNLQRDPRRASACALRRCPRPRKRSTI